MSIFASWVATLGFFFVAFLIGKFLQYREKSERLTRKMEDVLRQEVHPHPMATVVVPSQESLILGTIFGGPTRYEKEHRSKV
jgi:hypothetical protein